VVPHGLEPEYRPYHDKSRSTPFVFYNTFSSHSYPERKSCAELIRCFVRAFPGNDDVTLRLRTQQNPKIEQYLRDAGADDRIVIDPPDDCSTEDFARIYSDVHCTVHPSKGEGFGLIPFQSIACETPVIAPAVTGMADYLNADNAILLHMGGHVPGIGVGNQSGTYYSVDEDHLVHCLRHVYDHWEEEYSKVRQAAPAFRQAHSWDAALGPFSSLLGELLRQDRPDPASIAVLLAPAA
jgi:glycosyltransferase involved in cell wall biosynthesis